MAKEGEDAILQDETFPQDECVDDLSDVPFEFEDSEETEELLRSEKDQSDEEFSDNSEIHVRTNVLSLLSDTDDSDEDEEWKDADVPRSNNEFEGIPGPSTLPKDVQSVEDFVELFIGDDLFEFISTETNRYHAQSSNRNKQHKKCAKFVDVTARELKKWFALSILMGLVRKPRMDDYWSINPLIETPVFRKTMSRNRFRQILSFLHFSDNSNMPSNADRLCKVQPVIDYFLKRFQETFNPGQNICISEGVIPWRGQVNFKTCIRSKFNRYGILVRMLCDSCTGYISSFKVCSGQSSEQDSIGMTMELLTHCFGKWHHLYLDSYCRTMELVTKLFKKQIRVCGTVRQDREFPVDLKTSKLNAFETVFKRKGEVLVQAWKSSKTDVIRMISTIHNAELIDIRRMRGKTNCKIQKPRCVMDYNRYVKGMDRADHYLNYYPLYRKTIKWSKKVALYLFNCALFNAFRMYQHVNVNSKSLRFHDFLLKLCEAWLTTDVLKSEEDLDVSAASHASYRDSTDRLSGQLKHHQLIRICQGDRRKRRRCRVCSANKIRRTTNLMCKSCKVPLHLGDCFASYHLKKKY